VLYSSATVGASFICPSPASWLRKREVQHNFYAGVKIQFLKLSVCARELQGYLIRQGWCMVSIGLARDRLTWGNVARYFFEEMRKWQKISSAELLSELRSAVEKAILAVDEEGDSLKR